MSRGKLAGQVAHAAHQFLTEPLPNDSNGEPYEFPWAEEWVRDGITKIILKIEGEQPLLDLIEKSRAAKLLVHPVYDLGKTELPPNTLTCAAFGPYPSEQLNKITGHLRLLD